MIDGGLWIEPSITSLKMLRREPCNERAILMSDGRQAEFRRRLSSSQHSEPLGTGTVGPISDSVV